jgi:hypothetical protein
MLTLYITPVFYVYIEGARLLFAKRRTAPAAEPRVTHAPAESPVALLNAESSGGNR